MNQKQKHFWYQIFTGTYQDRATCLTYGAWYDTGQPYSTRKKPTEIQRTNLDKDEEELMSTSDTRTNSQKDISDENPS